MQTNLESARRSDLQAFNRLVSAHQAQLYTFSFRALGDERSAAESVQAALRRAQGDRHQPEAARTKLWLLRWAVAACQERLRDPGAAAPRPGKNANHAREPRLQGGLCRLPADLRLAVLLVDVTGLGYGEAAEVLGIAREQVSQRVAEARARLAADLAEGAAPVS